MHYWSSGNRAEVDFLMQYGNRVIPIEVKSDTNINGRSLIEFDKKYFPSLRLRYSMRNLSKDGNLINIPLFLADRTDLFLALYIILSLYICINIQHQSVWNKADYALVIKTVRYVLPPHFYIKNRIVQWAFDPAFAMMAHDV